MRLTLEAAAPEAAELGNGPQPQVCDAAAAPAGTNEMNLMMLRVFGMTWSLAEMRTAIWIGFGGPPIGHLRLRRWSQLAWESGRQEVRTHTPECYSAGH